MKSSKGSLRLAAAIACLGGTLLAGSAHAGLIGDTVRAYGVTNTGFLFLDRTVTVGSGLEIDVCTSAPSGICEQQLTIDFLDDGVDLNLYNLTGRSIVNPGGNLTYFGLNGPSDLTGATLLQQDFANNARCSAVTTQDLSCDYDTYTIAGRTTLRSLARFDFAPVPAPAAALLLPLALFARRRRRAR